jgi:hypothetical protein
MKWMPVVVAMLAVGFAYGCAKKASPEEVRQACNKAIALQQAVASQHPAEDPVDQVVVEFQQRLSDLKARQLQAVESVGDECRKQAEGPKKDDATAADEACVTAMNKKALEFAPEFQALNQRKLEALKTALDAKEHALDAAKVQAQKDVDDCTEQSLREGVTRAKVACQLAAATVDVFQKCR